MRGRRPTRKVRGATAEGAATQWVRSSEDSIVTLHLTTAVEPSVKTRSLAAASGANRIAWPRSLPPASPWHRCRRSVSSTDVSSVLASITSRVPLAACQARRSIDPRSANTAKDTSRLVSQPMCSEAARDRPNQRGVALVHQAIQLPTAEQQLDAKLAAECPGMPAQRPDRYVLDSPPHWTERGDHVLAEVGLGFHIDLARQQSRCRSTRNRLPSRTSSMPAA